jgi:transcriptional regulator with XRE-family HTH domain
MTDLGALAEAKHLRASGLLQREIAAKIGVRQPTVSRWLRLDEKPWYEPIDSDRSAIRLGLLLDNSGPFMETFRKRSRPERGRYIFPEHRPPSVGERVSLSKRSELVADPESDPAEALMGQRAEVQEILGDLDIDDLGRLNEYDLSRLRTRLIDAGVRTPSVREAR